MEQESKAKAEVFKLLSRRDYSEKEIREKLLKKGFSEEIVERVVEYIKEEGYINDRELGERLKELAIERGKSKLYLKKKLYQKGISSIEISYEEELEAAVNLLKKKYKKEKDYRKVLKFLINRGFSYSVASEAAKEFIEE